MQFRVYRLGAGLASSPLRPLFADTDANRVGTLLAGTEKLIEDVERVEPDIVGFSAFLTTTMPRLKANINALEKAGIRDRVIVMVGGAPNGVPA